MKYLYFLLILFINLKTFSQNSNYFIYHKLINKAEECFFVEQKTDSAIFY